MQGTFSETYNLKGARTSGREGGREGGKEPGVGERNFSLLSATPGEGPGRQ